MFQLFNKNKIELVAPVTGTAIPLEQVPDQVFASGMMGKGIAFSLKDGTVCAPCDGEITMIFPTKHAFGLKHSSGAEILVHVGLDTVALNGVGFEQLVKEGSRIKKGEAVLKVDLNMLREKGIPTETPMIITNSDDFDVETLLCGEVTAGKEVVLKCKKN